MRFECVSSVIAPAILTGLVLITLGALSGWCVRHFFKKRRSDLSEFGDTLWMVMSALIMILCVAGLVWSICSARSTYKACKTFYVGLYERPSP